MHQKPSDQPSATRPRRVTRWHAVAIASLIAVLATGSAVIAQVVGDPTPNAGGITHVWAARGVDRTTTNSTSWSQVPNAARTITVPAGGGNALIIARFTAGSRCGGPATAFCLVRILIGGGQGEFAGSEFAFDQVSISGTVDLDEANAMDRWRVLPPGTYTVQVQWKVSDATTTFALDDRSLIVEMAS